VPDSVNSELAALAEPLAVGLKLLNHAQVQPTERLLVIGAGPIGLAVVLWARQYAVGDILVSDPVRSRQSLALQLGATAVVDPTRESLTEACARELGGLPEAVIECVGRPGLLQSAAEVVAPYGRLILAGLHFESDTIARFEPLMKEITIKFSNFTVKRDFTHTLNLLGQGRLDPLPLITHRFGLDELPETVRALRTPNEFGKVLISPSLS
jgi:(R,R)-butanediol dehydrogenase/meso-butanediol dehydrogenase/diacetyl reductase